MPPQPRRCRRNPSALQLSLASTIHPERSDERTHHEVAVSPQSLRPASCHPEQSEGSAFAFLSVPATQFPKALTRITQSANRRDSRRPFEHHDARAVCSCRSLSSRASEATRDLSSRSNSSTRVQPALFLEGRSFSSDKKTGAQRLPLAVNFPRFLLWSFFAIPQG